MWVLLLLILAGAGLQVQACDLDPCTPDCNESCVNGSCLAPKECQCLSGHQFVNGSGTVCEPICSKNCGPNAHCTTPDKCTCNEGHVFVNGSSTDCEPLCLKSCLNGFCSGPNKCTCLEGYVKLLSHVCIALCPTPCVSGFCVAPNKCRCFTGYQPDPIPGSNICEPICSQGCGHGRCIAPEICLCDKGYAKRSAEAPCEVNKLQPESYSPATLNITTETDTNTDKLINK